MMLVFLIVVLSSIPLVASLVLIVVLIKSALTNDILLPSMQGEVEFTSPTTYKTAQGTERIRSVNFIGVAFGLLITRQDKKRFILWRDSMPEEDYRHLVVILKREH
ncbi:protein YgfX [Vibrio tubiashii]|uniref:protein YgfX n=1 Tax=Vibrio tubiashii TaxID=29498 RepID=UPI00234F1674|nr:protein YgfX [Vibrio tubiashii]WCP66666.1 protein YgfX [Vibrio tubiashii]